MGEYAAFAAREGDGLRVLFRLALGLLCRVKAAGEEALRGNVRCPTGRMDRRGVSTASARKCGSKSRPTAGLDGP